MLEGRWVRPWQNTGAGFPTNALTGRPYSGTNAFMLLIAGGGQWATYKQWQELGAQVRKGEKSTKILRPIIKKDPAKIKEDMLIGFSAASVFSAAQVDNYNAPSIEPRTFEDSAEAEAFVVATGAITETLARRGTRRLLRAFCRFYQHASKRVIHKRARILQHLAARIEPLVRP